MATQEMTSLAEWLDWQQRLARRPINMGLGRVNAVGEALGVLRPDCPVITVAGTNGKGSVIALLESMLQAAGYRTGTYTSPHLLRYNERIRVDGREADDQTLCRAFTDVEAARGNILLTYFEFGTLAALRIFTEAALDILILEVGLGGRLDAVNAVDADVAVVTTIDFDHTEWLGTDRDRIGWEKAGIYRSGRAAICGDRAPPNGLLEQARKSGARLQVLGRDFDILPTDGGFSWGAIDCKLPDPALRGDFQRDNAAIALAALDALADQVPVPCAARQKGLQHVCLPGRLQLLRNTPLVLADVAHNPQAARSLARTLCSSPHTGRTLAVFSALRNKDILGIVAGMDSIVDQWYVAGLPGPRGLQADDLLQRMAIGLNRASSYEGVEDALHTAIVHACLQDRVIVFGSFLTVAAALTAGL